MLHRATLYVHVTAWLLHSHADKLQNPPFPPPQQPGFDYQQYPPPQQYPGAAGFAQNLPPRPPGAGAPPGLPQRPGFPGQYGNASTVDDLVAGAARQGDDIDQMIRMAEAGIRPPQQKAEEPPAEKAGKKEKAMRMIYMDGDTSMEERLAAMPRYAVA